MPGNLPNVVRADVSFGALWVGLAQLGLTRIRVARKSELLASAWLGWIRWGSRLNVWMCSDTFRLQNGPLEASGILEAFVGRLLRIWVQQSFNKSEKSSKFLSSQVRNLGGRRMASS